MAKTPAFTPKPAVEKLPLALRKNIRDQFESEKESFETKLSEKIGTPFKINFNANEVCAYLADGDTSAGYVFKNYAQGFIDGIDRYLEKYGDDGKEYFNKAVTKSELGLGANTLGDKAPTISAEIKDGVYRILFKHDSLGYNASDVYDTLLPAVKAIPRPGFSLEAKHSIEHEYNSEIEDVQQAIGEILAIPDVILDPNFEENYKVLVADKKDDRDFHRNFGAATFAYFNDGLKYQLEYQGFKKDDMLQEGLAEVVTSKTFKLRVVPKLAKRIYNEIIIEDGVAYLQTTPSNWYCNTSDMGEGLLDIL